MPRNVRNFWIDANIDGRASTLSGGPKSSGGGMRLSILQRERGSISERGITVGCQVHDDGILRTFVDLPPGTEIRENSDGSFTAIFRTER